MAALLKRVAIVAALASSTAALAAENGNDRHQWRVGMDAALVARDSVLGAWTDGGLGKLRYGEDDDGANAARALSAPAQSRQALTPPPVVARTSLLVGTGNR